jgi:hypothetical protein
MIGGISIPSLLRAETSMTEPRFLAIENSENADKISKSHNAKRAHQVLVCALLYVDQIYIFVIRRGIKEYR